MLKRVIFILCCALSYCLAGAQVLTQFPADGNIIRGTLPCGADYYLIHNEKDKGHADFALVQKNHTDITAARKSLLSSGGFSENPYEFFSKKGVSGGKEGFVSFPDGSTVYHFRDVPCYDAAASDSTLLVLFDMMRSCQTGQAIIISGDVQASIITERLRMLSLTIDKLLPAPQTPHYQWKPGEELKIVQSVNRTAGTAKISVCFHAQRINEEAMNSPLPLVSRMFAGEMGIILKDRLWKSFYNKGIPVSGIDFRYRSSANGLEDELYTLNLSTSVSNLEEAVGLVSFELGKFDAKGASEKEYFDARESVLYEMGGQKPKDDNGFYVRKCVRNYLYGASLASGKSQYDFFTNRRLPINVELELFNNFVSALLSPDKAVDLNVSAPSAVPAGYLKDSFSSAWTMALADTTIAAAFSYGADTTALLAPKNRVKIKSEKKDVISGGVEWTFSNGMRVVFKKIDNAKRISFGMLLRGGITGVPSVVSGEAGFIQDMPGLYKVAGMGAMEFHAMLRANGIKMSTEAGLSDLRISGSAPAEKLPLMLRSLYAFSSKREMDSDAFEYYKKCESVILDERKHSIAGINDIEQNVMFPDFKYKGAKNLSVLGNDLPLRTEIWLKSLFGKSNDGVIVIVGDIEASDLQKILCRNLGGYQTSETIASKPKVREGRKNGWRTRYMASDINAVKIRTSVSIPYTSESALAFDVAKKLLYKELVSCLAPLGYYAEVESSTTFYPAESFRISVLCLPSDESGLAYGITPASSNKVLQAVRKAFIAAADQRISPADLKAIKEECVNFSKERNNLPSGVIDAVFTRASFGKNITGIKQENVNAVNEQSVRTILRGLEEGARLETVLQDK